MSFQFSPEDFVKKEKPIVKYPEGRYKFKVHNYNLNYETNDGRPGIEVNLLVEEIGIIVNFYITNRTAFFTENFLKSMKRPKDLRHFSVIESDLKGGEGVAEFWYNPKYMYGKYFQIKTFCIPNPNESIESSLPLKRTVDERIDEIDENEIPF